MFEHQKILDRIFEIEKFLIDLGFEKKNDFPRDWNLDSTIKYTPRGSNFMILYKNHNRVLLSIEVGIVSGLIFTFSGCYDKQSTWEQIHTDYYFKHKSNGYEFFVEELRDYKLKLFVNIENS